RDLRVGVENLEDRLPGSGELGAGGQGGGLLGVAGADPVQGPFALDVLEPGVLVLGAGSAHSAPWADQRVAVLSLGDGGAWLGRRGLAGTAGPRLGGGVGRVVGWLDSRPGGAGSVAGAGCPALPPGI